MSDTLKNDDALGFSERREERGKKQESIETMLRCGEWINGRRKKRGMKRVELFYMEPFTLSTLCTPSSLLHPCGLFSTKKSPCFDTRTVMLANCAIFLTLLKV